MDILEILNDLNAFELTAVEQARTEENLPELRWDAYFPGRDVNSVKLGEVTIVETREIGDRREWNADGRFIPGKKPKVRELEMVPMETWFQIGEREMQELGESTNGNRELMIQAAKASIPQRTTNIVDAILRGLEYESFQAWATGQIIAKNPQTGTHYAASLQIDAARYITPGSAWTDSNAYDKLIEFLTDAETVMGAFSGVYLRRAEFAKIQKSAPRLTTNEVRMTPAQIEDRIAQEFGQDFRFVIDERVVERFTGSGNTTATTKIWPTGKIAAIPAGGTVGSMLKAPQFRAQMRNDIPESVIDRNGIFVYPQSLNDGKAIKIQAQANWVPFPDEQKIYVVDAG